MSSCDLRIVFDGENRRFQPGDLVSGRVLVSTQKDFDVRLSLERRWRTHGRGNKTAGEPFKETLYDGRWAAGERNEYPFEFTAPDGPYTYHGTVLNVDWYLRAQADIKWKIDPKVEEEFILDLPAVTTAIEGEPFIVEPKGGCAAMVLALVGIPFFMFGAATIGVGIAHHTGAMTVQGLAWLTFLFGGVFALIGAALIFAAIRKRIARLKLGTVEVSLSSRKVGRGDLLDVALTFTPRSRVQVGGATATLRGVESVVSGSGTNRTTHTHQLHETETVLLEAGRCEPLEPVEAIASLLIPEDAPVSFSAEDNELKWSVSIAIDIPKWPDWAEEVPVTVVP